MALWNFWKIELKRHFVRLEFSLKCVITAKVFLSRNKGSFDLDWFRFDGTSNTRVFEHSFFLFWQFSNHFCQKSYEKATRFIMDIKSSCKLLLSHDDMRYRNYWKENGRPLIFFKFCTETRLFVCFLSLNGKFIANSCLMRHLKCVAIIYFIENWSFAKRLFPNYGPSIIVFHFC